MGSSYASSLYSGHMPEEEAKLREAVRLVREVMVTWHDFDHDQFDDAADDGAFLSDLGNAIRFIEDNLPDPVRKGARELADALKEIEQKNLAVERDANGWWRVGDKNILRWDKTIVEALAAYRRDNIKKGEV